MTQRQTVLRTLGETPPAYTVLVGSPATSSRRMVLVLRLWLVDDEGRGEWIGQITALPDQTEKETVRTMAELVACLERRLASLGSSGGSAAGGSA